MKRADADKRLNGEAQRLTETLKRLAPITQGDYGLSVRRQNEESIHRHWYERRRPVRQRALRSQPGQTFRRRRPRGVVREHPRPLRQDGLLWPAVDYQQIPKEIAKTRLEILQNKLFNLQMKFNESKINTKTKVLLENITKKGNQLFGRNEYMQAVFIEGTKSFPGTEAEVLINSCTKNNLFGTMINN